MTGGNVLQQIGEDQYYRVKASSAITKGQVVMFTGTLGASGGLTAAPATGLTPATGSYIMGVAAEDIANNGWGYISSFGEVRGFDTTGSSAGETWANGDILYYNPAVTGGLTKTIPVAPNAKVQVCAVVYAASNGTIFVRPTFEPRFNDLSDVYVLSPTNGDLVTWDNSNSRWVNAAQSTITAGSATNLAGGATGSVPYQSGSGTTTFLAAGSDGQVLKLASGVPTWSSDASGVTISDDTTTNATRYLTFTSATTGNITTENVASTKLTFNPSTGAFTSTSLTPTNALGTAYGGTGATSLAAANIPVTNVANTFTALQTLSGSSSVAALKVPNIKEVATVSATAATGTINFDITTQSVLYYTTDASANWTVNFRGSSGTSLDTLMSTGESMTATFLVTQGSTAYYNSAVTIDGSSVTPKWQGGSAPTSGNASGIDVYTYAIIKTGSATFTVLASITQFA